MAFMESMSDPDKSVLLEMFETGELCDFTFVGNDNSEIKVHAHVFMLSSLSEKCKTKIGSSRDSKLEFPVSNKCLRFFIKFVYEGPSKCELSEDILLEVIEMSNYFEIVELQELWRNFIESHVNEDNCFEFLAMSQLLPLSPSKNKILEFMAVNIKKLKDSELASLEKIQILNLLKHECLNMTQEEAAALTKMWVDNNRVTKSENQRLEVASQKETASRIPAEVVLAVGGWEEEPSRQSELYNPLTQSWGIITDKLVLPKPSMAYFGLEVIGSKLYLVGGYTADGAHQHFLDSLYRYNMNTQKWLEMSFMDHKRCYVSTAVVEDKIYAFGGHSGGVNGRLKSAEVYCPVRNQWDKISDMNCSRSDFASTVYNQAIYAIGGFNGDEYLNSIEKYDVASNNWTIVGHMVTPRSGASAIAHGDKIYIIGGFDGTQRLSSVECFTPGVTRCVWHQVPSLANCRSNFSACVLNDNEIAVIGGFKKNAMDEIGEVCSDVEILNVADNSWSPGAPLNIPRSALACVSCRNLMKFEFGFYNDYYLRRYNTN